MKRILIVLLIFPILTYGQEMRQIDFSEYELDNGLDVILHQDNSTPIVAVSVMYHVGSKNEESNRTGFAHFFEHLMFEGSENIDRGEFMNIVQAAGGAFNANTTQDRTYYYEILPSNQLELGLYLESERMLHAKVDSTGIETQREVVKEEKRQRYDNQPYMSFSFEIFSRAFQDHPYQWTPIGSLDDLNAASYEDFEQFYETFYVPNNATLVIAGDIDIDETKKLVSDYFSEIPKGKTSIPRPELKKHALEEEIRDIIYDNIQLPAVFQAYHMSEVGSEDYYALEMLTTLLSGGASSRLYKKLVDKQQKAVQVVAFPYGLEDAGLFINLAIANMGVDPETLEESINDEIETVKNELISEREFEKIRNQVKSQFVQSNATMAGIASSLATYDVLYGDANLINTEIEKYMQVTREDIKKVANKYLKKDNRVVLYYLPKSAQNESEDSEQPGKDG